MAVFVDLEDEDIEPAQNGQPPRWSANRSDLDDVAKAAAKAAAVAASSTSLEPTGSNQNRTGKQPEEDQHQPPQQVFRENPNQNPMTRALGCYPIVMSVAAHIDLNTLDSLSRTCRQVREGLLQYRKMLLVSTLHCCNEHLPVDPDETLRYRARAMNWFYMEDAGRSAYTGKTGQCARDLVAGCRRCRTVVCRNCAIKPPAPIVLRDRHRRLCVACSRAPLGSLVKPPLDPSVPLWSDAMQQAICLCDSASGVWLCQPCGRSIRTDDYEYKSIWKWRNQYTDVLGGLGTGIGEGDRGVICGRETGCCAAREREQETDCEAEDAARADADANNNNNNNANNNYSYGFGLLSVTPSSPPSQPWSSTLSLPSSSNNSSPGAGSSSGSSSNGSHNNSNNLQLGSGMPDGRSSPRTPSPMIKAGYERHEIEGIGGVMKKKLLRMVKVGACVPEWADERATGEILGREINGKERSWCGWCWRVIPGAKDCREIYGELEGGSKGKDKGKGVQ